MKLLLSLHDQQVQISQWGRHVQWEEKKWKPELYLGLSTEPKAFHNYQRTMRLAEYSWRIRPMFNNRRMSVCVTVPVFAQLSNGNEKKRVQNQHMWIKYGLRKEGGETKHPNPLSTRQWTFRLPNWKDAETEKPLESPKTTSYWTTVPVPPLIDISSAARNGSWSQTHSRHMYHELCSIAVVDWVRLVQLSG